MLLGVVVQGPRTDLSVFLFFRDLSAGCDLWSDIPDEARTHVSP